MPKINKSSKNEKFPKIIILIGFVVLVIGFLLIKNQPVQEKNQTVGNETPEQQLNRLMETGELILLFIHSTNCESCIQMMATVDMVYPEYEKEIALVDVDVYDSINQQLLQRARVSYIPTQIFIDPSGEGKVTVGAMTADDLRNALNELLEKQQ